MAKKSANPLVQPAHVKAGAADQVGRATPTSDVDDRFNQALTASANALLRHVIPLFNIRSGKRPVLVGTSLLVERNRIDYLVSARHVIDHAHDPGGLHYYVEPGKLHRLYGSVLRTQPHSGILDVDNFDISIVKLTEGPRPPWAKVWKVPVPFSSLRAFQFPRTGKEYLVTGFPKSRSRANPHSRQLVSEPSGFRVISADSAAYARLGLTEDQHIVLNLDIQNMRFPDGTMRRIADPHGMSGSPLWLLFDREGPNDSQITAVTGIAIEYHGAQKLLVATDIAVAIHLIDESAA